MADLAVLEAKAQAYIQKNDFNKARELYEKICKKNKKNADAFLMLGYLHSQLGEYDKAIHTYKSVLQFDKANPVTLFNLGLSYQLKADYELAIEAYRKSLKLSADLDHVKYNLAVCLQNSNGLDEAMTLYLKLLDAHPASPDILIPLGSIYIDLKNYQAAIEVANKLLQSQPNSSEALCIKGYACLGLEQYDEAIAEFKQALAGGSATIEAHYGLGEAYLYKNVIDVSIQHFNYIVSSDPGHYKALYKLGYIYTYVLSRTDKAEHCYLESLKVSPDYPEALKGLATIYEATNQWDKAFDVYLKMEQAGVDVAHAIAGRANLLERKNKLDDALLLLDPLMKAEQPDAMAVLVYANILKERKDYSAATALCEQAISYTRDASQLKSLHYRLGQIYNSNKQYDSAFESYKSANLYARQNNWFKYDDAKQAAYVEWCHKNFTQAEFPKLAKASNTSSRPVFIVGMPRSGTTLLEQIISSHHDVFGAGELSDIYDFVHTFKVNMGNIRNEDLTNDLSFLSTEVLDSFSDKHLNYLSQVSNDSLRVIDKMPGNFIYIWMIKLCFPNASIIHSIRDPVDTCLSIYFQDFTSSQSYATDLKTLGLYYLQYEKLMAHWNEVFGDAIFNVQYEELINDTETTMRGLLEYLDIPWDEQCLNFHQRERDVNTPSYQQVRQPIYKSSLKRWMNYQDHIADLLEVLKIKV